MFCQFVALVMLYAQRFDFQIELVEAELMLEAWRTVALSWRRKARFRVRQA
jgi:hypothetical protein